MKLSDIGEFELIGRITEKFRDLVPEGAMGIGDDCAVIPVSPERNLLVTTDMLVEDVHFLTDRISPYLLGRKSLTVNLSDISAMGGTPYAAFLSLSLPAETSPDWVDGFIEGFRSHGITLLGGDTTKSLAGITVNITAVGFAAPGNTKYRNGAKQGDKVVVTGTLGDAAGGLKVMLEDVIHDQGALQLIEVHNNPLSYVKSGLWLGKREEVHSMIDISDGLSSDIGHILEASGAGAEIDLAKLPLSGSLVKTAGLYGWNVNSLAVEGGEDYVLLFTVGKNEAPRLKTAYFEKFGLPLFEIGEITGSGKLDWLDNGRPVEVNFKGFDHF